MRERDVNKWRKCEIVGVSSSMGVEAMQLQNPSPAVLNSILVHDVRFTADQTHTAFFPFARFGVDRTIRR